MIAEQLQIARAAHWRQKQDPLLTLDDAQSWFQQHPLCLYLPRHAQLPAPAPSFVEACVGARQSTPGAEALATAQSLLIRLVDAGTVVPLNLLGTATEQPDFLASKEALPFVLSLRADADWKHAPQKSGGHKVSPLVLELWKALEKDGSMTAGEAREVLGRELTEAAVLRGLCELWQGLRVSPVYTSEGQPARWEMLRVHHKDALATATNTGQVTAISLLVSMYLQSVYAATGEEVEIFLSPVTSRSRVREAVRGLAATRQIHTLSMDAQTYYFLENGLPEFADVPASVPVEAPESVPAAPRRPMPAPRKMQATRPASAGQPMVAASEPIFKRPRPAVPPAMRPAAPAAKPDADRPAWKPAARSADKPYPRREGGQRPAFRSGGASSPRPGRSNEGFARSSERTEGRTQDRAPARPREGRPAFARPGTGRPAAARPGSDRPDSARSKFARSGSERPAGRPPFARPGGPRSGPDRPGSTRAPFARADSGSPASARPPAGGKPWRDAGTGARAGNRPKPWTPRPGTGEPRRDAPKPWALPGRKTGGPPRPPRPGAGSDRPFKSRAPRGDTRGPAGGGERPSPVRERPSSSRQPSSYRPNPRAQSPDRGPTQEAGKAPARSAYARGPNAAPGRGFPPRTGRPGPARSSGSAPDRPAFRRDAGPGERPRSSPRPDGAAGRPRPAGRPPYKPRFGAKEGAGGDAGVRQSKAPGESRGPRPPFVPGGAPRKAGFTRSGPASGRSAGPRSGERSSERAGPRPGGPPRKPGKPGGFRDRKPDRKKPGA